MREIKFRAWSTNTDNPRMLFLDPVSKKTPYGLLSDLIEDEGWKVMQYTGLKDKNGKEIYEGDIVVGGVYYGWKNETGKAIVKFGKFEQDGSGGEYPSRTCLGFYLDLIESQFGMEYGTVSLVEEERKHEEIEVIGNIYENKDLLGE